MESLSLRWFTDSKRSADSAATFTVHPAVITRALARWSLSAAVATFALLVATWAAVNPSVDQYLGAGLWASGFIFLALAIEVGIRKIFPYIFTGLALPILAVLGGEVAAEFSILGGAVLAGWLAFWVGHQR